MPTCEHFATELIRSLMAEPHLSSIRGSKDILFYSLHQLPSSFGCSDNVPAYTMPHGDRSKKRHDPILYDLSSVYHSQAPFTIQLIRSLLGEPHFSNVFATIDSMTENFLLLSPTYAGLSASSVAPLGPAVAQYLASHPAKLHESEIKVTCRSYIMLYIMLSIMTHTAAEQRWACRRLVPN